MRPRRRKRRNRPKIPQPHYCFLLFLMYTDGTAKDKDHRENNEDGWLGYRFLSTQTFEAMGTKRGMDEIKK